MFLTTGAVLEREKSICAAQLKGLWADLLICLMNNSKTYRNRNLLIHWNFVLDDSQDFATLVCTGFANGSLQKGGKSCVLELFSVKEVRTFTHGLSALGNALPVLVSYCRFTFDFTSHFAGGEAEL